MPRERWFHVILTTYAGWLHGDRRGFRTRHHREHIEGDYKNPPPAGMMYEERERRSSDRLRYDPAIVDGPWRQRLGQAVLDKLQNLGALVIAISVSKRHLHCLAKLPYQQRRLWFGRAKRHAWFELREAGWTTKLWGKGGKFLLVRTREHQLRVFYYILKHRVRGGAWVWTIRDAKPKN